MADQQQPEPRQCTGCGGQKGYIVEENDRGKLIQTWRTCQACGGTGIQGGGI